MRIFITGGRGFIGSHLVDLLKKGKHTVASFDALLNFANNQDYYKRCLAVRKKYLNSPDVDYKGDIRSIEELQRAISQFDPEVVVHLAAIPMARVPENHINDMNPINLMGMMNVFNTFEHSNAKRIIYTSSSMIYGHFKQTPQSEDFIPSPINFYGAAKAAGEHFVKLSKKEWVIIRPTSVYGFADCANRVTQILLDSAILGKPAWVVKGETLDFSFVPEVAAGFVKAIENPSAAGETFNISRGVARGASEFGDVLKKYYPKFSFEVRDPSSQQVWRGPLDSSKAQKILGFSPNIDIEEGIKQILDLDKKYDFYQLETNGKSSSAKLV